MSEQIFTKLTGKQYIEYLKKFGYTEEEQIVLIKNKINDFKRWYIDDKQRQSISTNG